VPPIIPTDPYNRLFIAHANEGERGWEIGSLNDRERICADMHEKTAVLIFHLLCQAAQLRWKHDIPYEQIVAVWRLVEEQGGIPTDIKI
jgi:hypothetical protein